MQQKVIHSFFRYLDASSNSILFWLYIHKALFVIQISLFYEMDFELIKPIHISLCTTAKQHSIHFKNFT